MNLRIHCTVVAAALVLLSGCGGSRTSHAVGPTPLPAPPLPAPCVGQRLPSPPRALEFLYYWDDSFYGNYRGELSGTINATVIWEGWFQTAAALDASFQDAISRGLRVYYSPNFDPSNGLLSAPEVAARYWDRVLALYADEPSGSRAEIEQFLNERTAGFQARGLVAKPWYVNFTDRQFLTGDGWRAANIAVLGFEVYMDPARQNDPGLIAAAEAKTDQFLGLIGRRPTFMVVQAYNRNGQWTNMMSLRDLQTVAYRKATSDVIGLWLFSFGRPGGTRDLPACIRREHVRMWNGNVGGSPLPRLACDTGLPDDPGCGQVRSGGRW